MAGRFTSQRRTIIWPTATLTWMRPVYAALGTSVAAIRHDMDDDERRAAYAADVTYATASEFGFDHLRDAMRFAKDELVQRGLAFALVDEADAILIDEARVPLSLFGPLGDRSAHYQAIDHIVATLDPRHYDAEHGRRRVALSEAGSRPSSRRCGRPDCLRRTCRCYDTDADRAAASRDAGPARACAAGSATATMSCTTVRS